MGGSCTQPVRAPAAGGREHRVLTSAPCAAVAAVRVCADAHTTCEYRHQRVPCCRLRAAAAAGP